MLNLKLDIYYLYGYELTEKKIKNDPVTHNTHML